MSGRGLTLVLAAPVEAQDVPQTLTSAGAVAPQTPTGAASRDAPCLQLQRQVDDHAVLNDLELYDYAFYYYLLDLDCRPPASSDSDGDT